MNLPPFDPLPFVPPPRKAAEDRLGHTPFMKNSLASGLLAVLTTVGLTACFHSQPPPAMPTPKVTTALPQSATITNWDEYPGHVEAVESVEIRPRVSGYIDSIHFQDGAEVKVGDLLFVIDPRPFQAELERARAERQVTETRLDLAKNDLERAETLRGTRAISVEELDSRNKTFREAQAALTATKAAEAIAQLNLDYTRVTAPIAGRIGRRLVTVGNLVQGGGMVPGTLLAALVSLDPVYCYFDADEAAFLRYRKNGETGEAAGSKPAALECDLALVNETSFPHRGRVDFFDNAVNPQTGTIRMRGAFANADRTLVPGMFATVRVPAGPPVTGLLVPAVAIGSDQGNKFVLIVNATGVVELRPVQVGRQEGALRVVTAGLTVKDQVIVNGLMMARPGGKVEVVNDAAPPVAAVAPGAK